MKFGVALGLANPRYHADIAVTADRSGFESVWLPEHLIFPVAMQGSPHPGSQTPPVPPDTPLFDAFAYLAHLAGLTRRIRLGTHVYLPALRHPFVFARAVQTLDIVSEGRAEVGIGTGWLAQEFAAAGIDFASRGRRTDESIRIARELWTQDTIEHAGEFYRFEAVKFEPKPKQTPHPPLHIGGESNAALRRVLRHGAGWIGMAHSLDSVVAPIEKLHRLADRENVAAPEITVMGTVEEERDLSAWEEVGVDRLIVAPWQRSSEAIDGLRAFAQRWGLVNSGA